MIARARLLILVVGVALTLSACGSDEAGDPELAIYLSAPLSGPRAADGRDIADGARLALADAGGEAAGIAVDLNVLDDATDGGWQSALSGANARRASEDASAIAYIGELDSGATRTSLPITNQAGLLQVSSGSGADDLTRDFPGGSQIPELVQPSGSRTFGRVIPSDVAQGEAAADLMSGLGIRSVEVIRDESAFSGSLRAGLESVSDAPAITGAEPDAIFFATADAGPEAKLPLPAAVDAGFGSDALLDPTDIEALGGPISVTSAALDPRQLPASAAGFLSDFEAAYDRLPGRYSAYGYEAMAVALDSISRAEDPLDRSAVVDAFFATADRDSILGTYSIDEVGDTSLPTLGAYEILDGRAAPLAGSLQRP